MQFKFYLRLIATLSVLMPDRIDACPSSGQSDLRLCAICLSDSLGPDFGSREKSVGLLNVVYTMWYYKLCSTKLLGSAHSVSYTQRVRTPTADYKTQNSGL